MTAAELEAAWAKANPRPYWTPEFWAACRPDHDQTEDAAEAVA